MTDHRWQHLFNDTPGALYGNRPGAFGNSLGNITVDIIHGLAAIDYLRRRVRVLGLVCSREPRALVIVIEERLR